MSNTYQEKEVLVARGRKGSFYIINGFLFPRPMPDYAYVLSEDSKLTPESLYRFIKGYKDMEKRVYKRTLSEILRWEFKEDISPNELTRRLNIGVGLLTMGGSIGSLAYGLALAEHPLVSLSLLALLAAPTGGMGLLVVGTILRLKHRAKKCVKETRAFLTMFIEFINNPAKEGIDIQEWGKDIIRRIESKERITLENLPPEFVKYLSQKYPELAEKILTYVAEQLPVPETMLHKELQKWRPEDRTPALLRKIKENIVIQWKNDVEGTEIRDYTIEYRHFLDVAEDLVNLLQDQEVGSDYEELS
jgi:hypothetical protein